MASGSLIYTPSKTVREFMLSDADMRAICGPVGSGKTTGCIVELLRQAILMPQGGDGLRRSRMLIIRNTKTQLKDTTLASVLELLPLEILKWHESSMTMRLEFNDVRSDWLFRSLDTPEDVQRVLSMQVTWVWVEEAREIPVPLLSDLEGRSGRYPSQAGGFHYRSGILYSTNPPEIDSPHYRLLESLPQVEGEEESVIVCDTFHQPSGLSSEAENIENLRPGYYEKLARGKAKAWVDVYVHGKYGMSQAGKPVYERTFQYHRHVSKTPLAISPHSPVIIGMDCARTPGALLMQVTPDGRIFILREAYAFDMGAKNFIAFKLNPVIKGTFPGNVLIFTGDPSWVRQNETDDNSWYKELKKTYPRDDGHVVKAAPTNDPIVRINALDTEFFDFPGGEPKILIDPSCKWFIAGCRSKYRYMRLRGDKDKLQDKPDKNDWSHIVEAGQYGVMFATSKNYDPADYIRASFNPLTQTTQFRPADGMTGY